MIQEKRKGRKDKREGGGEGEEREGEKRAGREVEGNINSQFHTFTHVRVIRTIM